MPASYNDVVEHMFGGRHHKRAMVVKVYAVNKESAQKQAEAIQAAEAEKAALQQQVNALQQELQNTQTELEQAQLDARINAQKNNNNRSRR
jgi:uncharacterized protein YPO0396